jgi:biotin carboxyl carrier protein
MSLEIQLGERISSVELVTKDKNLHHIKVDGEMYVIDIIKAGNGMYSILHNGRSYKIELHQKENAKQYNVSIDRSYDIEIIDAETRYLMNRKGNDLSDAENTIASPMPGKVVKILVKKGQKVKTGQTVIIVSAMKMESEYKAGKEGIIKQVHVNEGDTIEGHQPLITLE